MFALFPKELKWAAVFVSFCKDANWDDRGYLKSAVTNELNWLFQNKS